MTETYRCSYDEMLKMLKSQYDGYHFSKNMTDIYNPFSLLNAFATLEISDYYFVLYDLKMYFCTPVQTVCNRMKIV